MTIPVRRMVLYKHGVGFIERGQKFDNDEPLKLNFKKDTMDDILKSLCIFDMGKGRVTGLSYETGEDISLQLAEKAIQVPDQQALIGLLRQLKGYAVKLETSTDGTIEGTVVGTQEGMRVTIDAPPATSKQVIPNSPMSTVKDYVVMKDGTGSLLSVDIEKIMKFHILDPEASADLDFFLDAVTSIRKKNNKAVTVFFEGGNHDLKISYIMAMPSWRVSYRLAFDKKETILQGWGIIDNKLDEDLKDISLSLVAGKPISFIYDIYTPRIVPRPIVREEVRTVSAPVELEGGMEQLAEARMMAEEASAEREYSTRDECKKEMAPRRRAMAAPCVASSAPGGGMGYAPQEPPADLFAHSQSVQTKTVEMGEFFKYDIDTPVTVKRGQSAMVPILQCPITCFKEHIYNNEKMPKNPVVTMKLKNDTGAVLERGPILVLDENTYVGEAILPYTTTGSENHVAYSVDLGVIVNEKYNNGSDLKQINIAGRYLQKEHLEWKECEYEVQNKKKDNIDLVIEHRKSDYIVDEKVTQKATDTTESYYRWKFKMDGKTSSKFKVRETMTRFYSEEIRTQDVSTMKYYIDNNYISKRDYKDVKDILDVSISINDLRRTNNELMTERARIQEEQSRLRSNMNSLGSSNQEAKLRTKYVEKLDAQEKRFEEILETIEKNEEKIKELEKKVDEMLTALEKRGK
jgi:hypothetical protein